MYDKVPDRMPWGFPIKHELWGLMSQYIHIQSPPMEPSGTLQDLYLKFCLEGRMAQQELVQIEEKASFPR